MDVLTGIGAFWLSTWIMILFRTVGIINRLVDTYEIALVQKYRALHFIVYTVMIIVIAPLLWQVIPFDESRKRFVLSYVDALRKRK